MEKENSELKNIIEAALLTAGQPLTLKQLGEMFNDGGQPAREELEQVLAVLGSEYEARGIELKRFGNGWRLQTR